MLTASTRWILPERHPEEEEAALRLARALNLAPLAARLLIKRGYRDEEAARAFLSGGPERLHDPYRMRGMEEAVGRIRLALERGERIRIFGDYDADGVSSTVLVTRLLGELSASFDHVVPHRTLDGYGLSVPAVEAAAADGIRLIVTVDNGISAVDAVARAAELGVDVVVTDHHEPPPQLPAAAAIVNPKQPDCPYPFKGLAGVGVAFKLAHALLGRPPLEWTELAALGTIADLMPLTDENRILVRHGLERMRRTKSAGIRALAAVSRIDLAAISAESVAFGMAPRINAAGRLEHADTAVRLLLADDAEEAAGCAAELDELNRRRQRLVDALVEQAEALWADKVRRAEAAGRPAPGVIVVAGEGWNAGVVGIVASKLIERHYRPTVVLAIDAAAGTAKGSARSISGFDLHAALTAAGDLLDHYGGHQAAAGMTLAVDKLEAFEERLSRLAEEWLTEEDFVRKTEIDIVCPADEATLDAAEQLRQLEPFGVGNPRPTLMIEDAAVRKVRTMGKDARHLHCVLDGPPGTSEAVGFGMGERAAVLSDTARLDLIGELGINEWNGVRKAQLFVRDLRVRNVQLFDGRRPRRAAAGGADGRLRRLQALRERGVAAEPAVVFTADAAAGEAAAAAEEPAGAPAGWLIRSYDDQDAGLAECRSIVLIDPPPSEERLAGILAACRAPAAVYALYDMPAQVRLPDRGEFGEAYRLLREALVKPMTEAEALNVLRRLPLPPDAARLIFDVFTELGFLEIGAEGVRMTVNPARRSLEDSVIYREAMRADAAGRLWSAPAAELAGWIGRRCRLAEINP